jgi:hypothetical protein
MPSAESAKTFIGVVILLLLWGVALTLLNRRLKEQRKAEATLARDTAQARRHRVLDRIGLVIAALVVCGVASYAEFYRKGWSALVLVLVCIGFTFWARRLR